MNDHDQSAGESEREASMRTWIGWVAAIGACLIFAGVFWQIYDVSALGMWDKIAQRHFAAVIGLPFAALAGLFIVLTLRTITGPIEIKIPAFEFRGASGPIIMWLLCFLAIARSILWLWPLKFEG